MKRALNILAVVVLTVAVILLIRLFGVSLIEIPENGERPVFSAGDRVLVNKTAYGLRFCVGQGGVPVRWGMSPVQRGDWLAFNNPAATDVPLSRRDVFIGFCYAVPGDTLWVASSGNISCVRPKDCGKRKMIILPRKGRYVRITPDNIRWYQRVINNHEGIKAEIIGDSLCVGGHIVGKYRFMHDYYWVSSAAPQNHADSRTFGFVPFSHVIGKLTYVLYSWDKTRPWYARFRQDRLLMKVTHGYTQTNNE